jgi:hypothetical protein
MAKVKDVISQQASVKIRLLFFTTFLVCLACSMLVAGDADLLT